MNWVEFWPEMAVALTVTALTGIVVSLARKLTALRQQLGESRSLARRLKPLGLSNFYESRDDYTTFRKAPRLADYLEFANRRIIIAGYWLAQGNELEGVTADIRRLLERRKDLEITVVVINPDAAYVSALATHMGLAPAAVAARARDSLRTLVQLRSSLAPDTRQRLDLRMHTSIPFASLILLDPDNETDVRIQFDFKPYGTPRSDSIGFEIRSRTSQIGSSLIQSCQRMVEDAVVVVGDDVVFGG